MFASIGAASLIARTLFPTRGAARFIGAVESNEGTSGRYLGRRGPLVCEDDAGKGLDERVSPRPKTDAVENWFMKTYSNRISLSG